LRAKDGSRSHKPDPSDERSSWESVFLAGPESDKGSCSAESCLAMDSDCSFSLLHKLNEVIHNLYSRRASINEIQVVHFEPKPLEPRLVIGRLVQSDDSLNVQSTKQLAVVLWSMESLPILIVTLA
jgi:hypothetical protein